MVRAMRPWASATGRWTLLHFPRCRYGWVIEVQVHANTGSTSCSLDVSPHTTGGSPALVFILNACVHCCGGSQGVGRGSHVACS